MDALTLELGCTRITARSFFLDHLDSVLTKLNLGELIVVSFFLLHMHTMLISRKISVPYVSSRFNLLDLALAFFRTRHVGGFWTQICSSIRYSVAAIL